MRATCLIGAATIVVLAVRAASAQGTNEIEVYSTEIVPVKSLVLELHSNYTFRGSEASTAGVHVPLIDDALMSAGTCTTAPFFQRNAAQGPRAAAFDNSACTLIANSYATHETIKAVTGLSSWSEFGAYLFTS